jgi:hypothetical protein
MLEYGEIEKLISRLVEERKRHMQATSVLELCEMDRDKRRAEIGADEGIVTGKNAEIRKDQLTVAVAQDAEHLRLLQRVAVCRQELGIADIEVEAARRRISLTEAWLRSHGT